MGEDSRREEPEDGHDDAEKDAEKQDPIRSHRLFRHE